MVHSHCECSILKDFLNYDNFLNDRQWLVSIARPAMSASRKPTYSRYEGRIEGILGETKQYARLANSGVANQQQLEQIVVGFCHRQLVRIITPQRGRPINSIIRGKSKRMPRLRPLQQQQHHHHSATSVGQQLHPRVQGVRNSKLRSTIRPVFRKRRMNLHRHSPAGLDSTHDRCQYRSLRLRETPTATIASSWCNVDWP